MEPAPFLSFPFVDELCLFIEMSGLLEGVFRIPGDQMEAQEIVNRCNQQEEIKEGPSLVLPSKLQDPHSVASALKLYLRSHPQCLLGPDAWANIQTFPATDDFMEQSALFLLKNIPKDALPIFTRLFDTLIAIMEATEITKMNAANLSMVLAPLMIRTGISDMQKELMASKKVANILHFMLDRPNLVLCIIPASPPSIRLLGTLHGLTDLEKMKLSRLGKVLRFKQDEIIPDRFNTPGFVYAISSGVVAIMKGGKILQRLSEGMLLDYGRYLGSTHQILFSMIAASNCSIAEIPTPVFYSNLHFDEELQWKFTIHASIHLADFRYALSQGAQVTKKKRRRNVVVSTPPIVRLIRNPMFSASDRCSGVIVVKVYTDIVGEGVSKIITATEESTIGQFKKKCLEKFLITTNPSKYHFTLLRETTGQLERKILLEITDEHKVVSLADSSLLLLYLSLKRETMLSLSTEFSFDEQPIFVDLEHVKMKSSHGKLSISSLHIIHISKEERHIIEIAEIIDISFIKQKELLLLLVDRHSVTISSTKENMISIYHWLKILTCQEPEKYKHFIQAKNDLSYFLLIFPLRNGVKPPSFYPSLIEEYEIRLQTALLPFYRAKEVDSVSLTLHDFILSNLYEYLFKSEAKEKEDEQLEEHRRELRDKLQISYFFPDISQESEGAIQSKLQSAVDVLNQIQRVKIPSRILDLILRSANLLYEAMISIHSSSNQFLFLVILSVLQSDTKLNGNIALVRRYVDSEDLKRIGEYFIIQLEEAIAFLDSEQRSELKNASTANERPSLSQSLISSCSSETDLSQSANGLSDLLMGDDAEKMALEDAAVMERSVVDVSFMPEYSFVRALAMDGYVPSSPEELAFPMGAMIELYCGTPFVKNPLEIYVREGYYFASYFGCFGWIPHSACQILREADIHIKFQKKGYSSVYLFPTASDWIAFKKLGIPLTLKERDCVVEEGNVHQYLYLVMSGKVMVEEANFSFIIGQEDFFGLRSFLTGKASTETVSVSTVSSLILRFDPRQLYWFFEENKATRHRFLYLLACELAEQLHTHYLSKAK